MIVIQEENQQGPSLKTLTTITALDLPSILTQYPHIKTLSLDCFDTLVWRLTAQPKDVFYVMQESELFKRLKVTAYQRINAAARAYREAYITEGHHQISLEKIYSYFTSLTKAEQDALIEEEIKTELSLCYAFPPMVELVRQAHQLGLKVIIVSDTYLKTTELQRLLAHTLPEDAMAAIDQVYCSSTFKKSKSDGLFEIIKQELGEGSETILHIGDHEVADFKAPRQSGLQSLHFIQYNPQIADYLHNQHTISPLTTLSNPYATTQKAIRYSPFRGMFALTYPNVHHPETSIGYMTFGPMLFAFAKFVTDEINALQAQGKQPKVFFLLRDAYLLSKACEAYQGSTVGKLIRLRKFVSVAASFHTLADIDHYLSSIKPQHFNMIVIGEQLLLPWQLTQQLIQLAHQSPQPDRRFYELIRHPDITKLIFSKSAEYRQQLSCYLHKEMNVQPGDTIVLVDTGYIGVTQEYFTRTFKDTLQMDVRGLYFMGSHEPDRPNYKALLDSDWCEHGLFEQSCTYKEGAVLGYNNEGDPIFDKIKLSDEQYNKVDALQTEALRFITDAKKYFSKCQTTPDFHIFREYARAALTRQIFFPNQSEAAYFSSYQHDKDMGADGKKTMFNLSNTGSYQYPLQPNIHPYEARSVGLQETLGLLLKKGFELDFKNEPNNFKGKEINLLVIQHGKILNQKINAISIGDGYFKITTPPTINDQLCIMFGDHFQWIQIDSINLSADNMPPNLNINQYLSVDNIINKGGNLFECQPNGKLILMPIRNGHMHQFNIVFRPIIDR